MSLAIVYTRANCGIEAPLVSAETHLSNGLPALNIVGLPEKAVKESKDRVRSAILNSHFEFPSRRITINLAPADLPKEGGRFDLAIALGILAASGQIPSEDLTRYEFLGELSLEGELRSVRGSLTAAIASSEQARSLFLPQDNIEEASLCSAAQLLPAKSLLQIAAHLHGREKIISQTLCTEKKADEFCSNNHADMTEVRGQSQAKRALEIAAAGNHNLLFCGPPGTGKTMLASRLPGILPSLGEAEMLEVASIYSISSQSSQRQLSHHYRQRPFRNPHHTASAVALVGGGSHPKPGEISLAHHGVLFLDELPEFQRKVLEVLREPMESGEIIISRANQQLNFPARFQLVAAMNPCPCGFFGDKQKACRCTPDQVRRYRDKISGPMLDRIDIQLTVNRLPAEDLTRPTSAGENSQVIRQRVQQCRALQLQRQDCYNAQLSGKKLQQHCTLEAADQALLNNAIDQLQLSPRAYYKIIKVARTLADLEASSAITKQHLTEALAYRSLDKNL